MNDSAAANTVFISDLHLSEAVPDLNALFFRSLDSWRGKTDSLYILGDFFDVWIGDDDDNDFIRSVKAALKSFTDTTPVVFMAGNRDFLLGSAFAAETGIRLTEAPLALSLYGHEYVVTHGDELCTDDLAYQQFRAQARNPMWQAAVLSKPLAERRLLAGQIRQMSETRKTAEGKSEISDATEAGIAGLMQPFLAAGAPALIHGHTHRPGVFTHQTAAGRSFTRYVLQDWHDGKGGCMIADARGITVEELV